MRWHGNAPRLTPASKTVKRDCSGARAGAWFLTDGFALRERRVFVLQRGPSRLLAREAAEPQPGLSELIYRSRLRRRVTVKRVADAPAAPIAEAHAVPITAHYTQKKKAFLHEKQLVRKIRDLGD
ncbi:hypothetical protein AAFF_G00012780 [Aldrovandia affinis]|uniref:Uncharacterized protein n=1 Tax=Aldrovandia affinis TaxID=143900 RepID=A0AAD7S6L3_9TELE|nr:hypothetical protein AAFF_G00012780 [Aldrovandia affinis]